MEDLREYGNWARVAQERISQELAELKGTNDRRKLSELHILASTSFVGMDRIVSEDKDIESIESETSEELEVEHAMWEALQKLATAANAVEAELHLVDDSEEANKLSSPTQKKVRERWFDGSKAS